MTSKPHIQLEALHALARALAAGEFRARAVLERACAVVAEGFGFERVGIVRYVPATSVLIPFAAHGLSADELETLPAALPIARFARLPARARDAARALFVPEPGEEDVLPTPVAREFGIGSFVLVPLISEGRCLGFMTCDERGEAFWLEPPEIELLATFGALIAAFLERAIQHAELRRLNELKSQFAALASHELRTPVAAIYGAVETLDAREDGPLAGAPGRAAPHALASSRSGSSSSSRTCSTSRGSRRIRSASSRRSSTCASALVGDRRRRLRQQRGSRSTSRTGCAPSSTRAPSTASSPISLLNARSHGEPPITVSARRSDGELSLTVEDRGPGIADEFLGSVFERFTRGATAAGDGAGLGLSIAQSYARAHGGSLAYEPAQPHGARFRVTLPG